MDRGDDWRLVSSPKDLAAAIKAHTPEFIFFLHWSTLVPADIVTKQLCVNFHCTPLPYGRGGSPIENMILRGHEVTIITAHRMTETLDAGPVYGTIGPVALLGTKDEILDSLATPCVELMTWIARTRPEATPQTGEVVHFERLAPPAFEAFWAAREQGLLALHVRGDAKAVEAEVARAANVEGE
jgi:methionyl-tRNA formyltransferase